MARSTPTSTYRQPWFSLFELSLVVLAGGLWYNWPELGWIPVILPLIPWTIRALQGGPLFTRTPLDALFLLFLLTALAGVWASYNRAAAWAKFWLILDGVFLYYAIAGQPHRNRWWVAGGLGAFSAALAVYFFLTHDFRTDPANIALLNEIGLAWMQFRPTLPTHILHSNVVAGIMAMTSPFLAAIAAYGRRVRDLRFSLAGFLGLLLVAPALFMTTSRGAWLGLALGVSVWGLWKAIAYLGRKSGVPTFSTFLVTAGIIFGIGIVIVVLFPNNLAILINNLPGPATAGSRLDLINAGLALAGDFPFTGGGLTAFSGLYSTYILVNPSHVLPHGHNLFIDVSLEQGLLGGMLLILILGQSLWIMLTEVRDRERKHSTTTILLWASLVGTLTLILHGLADDILYGSRAPILLWVFPGIAAGIQRVSANRSSGRKTKRPKVRRFPVLYVVIGVALLGFYFFLFRNPLLSTWHSNIGAVEMAKVELAFFPQDRWDDGSNANALRPAAARLERAISYNGRNSTARHRLGQIAMLFRDFNLSVQHLEIARRNAPFHPGISKLLAYNYVWVDRYNEAGQLLAGYPEARFELTVYEGWWRAQGREDLSQKAALMAENLAIISNE